MSVPLLTERIKDPPDILFGYPDPSVLTAIGSQHMGFIRLFLGNRQSDPFPLRREFGRIANDIHQNLFGSCHIPHDAGRRNLLFHDKFHAPALNVISLHGGDLIDHRRYQHRFFNDIHLTRLQLGHIQHIIHQG